MSKRTRARDMVERQAVEALSIAKTESKTGDGGLALEVQALREEIEQLRISQAVTDERCRQLAKEKADLEGKVSKLESSVLAAIAPFYFTLHNYTHHKKHGLKWRSPPFYSHPWGYKVSVEVVAGGSSVGEGSHVSVHVHVLRGEYDSQLQWPFRGCVTLQLLNERGEWGHFEKTVVFADDTPLVNSGRVGKEGERSEGWGDPLFIAHSCLNYNPVTDAEYMKFDRLRFLVSKVQVDK